MIINNYAIFLLAKLANKKLLSRPDKIVIYLVRTNYFSKLGCLDGEIPIVIV